jgi:low affinity Fe/Cu permease
MSQWFTRFAHRASALAGHHLTFFAALALIVGWAITGPFFGFSETWQLVINTGTTIITFLMVFLIQNTQNRDAMAMHLKLDEVIRAIDNADNAMMRAEDETMEELEELKREYEALYAAHAHLKAKLAPVSEDGTHDEHHLYSSPKQPMPASGGQDPSQERLSPSPRRSSKSDITATFSAEAEPGSNS